MPGLPQYTYLLADLRTNVILGEVPLVDVKYSKVLNDSGTAEATLHVGDPRIDKLDLYNITTPARTALYILRDSRPMWGGIIWTRSYSHSTGAVTLGAADWWSYFDHRMILPILPANPDTSYVSGLSVAYDDDDQNDIARALVALAQTHTAGDIGIEFDTTSSGIFRDRTYWGYELRNVGDALRQLAGVLDGPDMMFDVAADDGDGRPRRVLRLGEPRLGQAGTPHVFELGGNVLDFEWPSDASRYISRAYATGDGTAEGTPIAVSEDTTMYGLGWPLMETEIQYSGVEDPATLQGHADADQQVGRLPVVLPKLTMRGSSSPTVTEYGPGDDARVVLQDAFFRKGIDTSMRVVRLDVEPAENLEKVAATFAPLLDDVA